MDEVKLCESIRVSLWRETGDRRWGIVSGDFFGYELGSKIQECNLLLECEFQYELYGSHLFHALIFNKAATRAKFQRHMDIKNLGISTGLLSKIVCFALLMSLLYWIRSICQESAEETQGVVCRYKYVVMVILALMIIVVYTVCIVYIRIRNIRQMQFKDSKKTN